MTYHKNSKKKRVVCAVLAFVLGALPVGNASLAFAAENDSPFPYRIHNTISHSAKPPKADEWRMEDTATPGNAASPSDSTGKATASNAERVTLNVFSEDSFNPGEEAVLRVVIQNKTDEALTQGVVSYSAYGINPEYSSFLGEDRSDEEEMLEHVVIPPHDTYEFQYQFRVPDHETAKNYWISFCLNAWKEDEIVRSTENFLYNAGVMRVGTIDFPEGNEVVAGNETKMDIYLEDFFLNDEDNSDGYEESGTPSQARRTVKQEATPSNAGKDGKLKYTVEFKGLAIKDISFRSLNEDDKSDRTEMEAVFQTEKNCEPGTYYGVVTAQVKRGRTTYQSTQSMVIEVARPELTAEINGVEIRIASPSEAFPRGKQLSLEVTELPREEGTPEKELLDSAVSASAESPETGEQAKAIDAEKIPAAVSVEEYRMFDIKVLADGEEVEPEGPVQVSFTGIVPEKAKAEKVEVYHIDTETRQTEQMQTEVNESGNVVMETTHFSVYAVVLPSDNKGPYQVQFRHLVKGENGNYSEYYRRGEATVGDIGNNTAIIGITDFCKNSYDVDKIDIYKMDQNGEKTGKSIRSLDQTNIVIQQDTVVEIYYKEAEVHKEEFPVTYYDYDVVFTGSSVGGINDKSNYSSSKTNQRLMVGTKSWVPLTDSNGVYRYKFGSYGTYSVSMTGGLDADENNAPPNGMDGHTPYGGTPIVQGIIKSLDNNGNPIFGTTSREKPIVDPGLFTAKRKIGKTIYSAEDGQFSLVFKKQGEKYVLDSSVNNETGKVTSADTNNQFFPLDDVKSAQMFPNDEQGNNGRKNNWYFGMRFETTFTIGDYIGPLNFTFSGDDDMWVFIDNELVLDLGGMHSAYPNVYAEHGRPTDIKNSVNLWSYLNHDSKYNEDAECDLSRAYDEEHKLTILYMERGGFDSNCRIEFAIPLDDVPQYQYRSTVDVPVKKVWNDMENVFGSRPSEVTVQLYRDGTLMENETKILNGSNDWKSEWEDLPRYERDENGWDTERQYEYSVREVNVPKDYTPSYSKDEDGTLVVTNTWKEGKIEGKLDISKRIDWLGDEGNNRDTKLNGSDDYRLYLEVSGKMDPPIDLVLVLDKSASMTNNGSKRLQTLRKVLLGDTDTDKDNDGFIYNFLKANPDNKISIVNFSGGDKNNWLSNANGMPAWEKSSGNEQEVKEIAARVESYVPSKAEGGTNYGAGLYKAHELLNQVSGDGNRKFMIFLSDGVPTYYLSTRDSKGEYPESFTSDEAKEIKRFGDGTEGNYGTCKDPNITMVNNFRTLHSELTIYTVGFDMSKNKTEVLAALGDENYAATSTNVDSLQKVFNKMFLGPNNIVITDQLSDYVDFADDINWKIEVTNNVTGETQQLLMQGEYNNGEIIESVNFSQDKKITVKFNPDFRLNVFNDYTLSFDVKVNDYAYTENDKYGYNATGDPDTDYLPTKNKSSSGADGFYSNEEASAKFQFTGEEPKEKLFPKPVVQVAGKQIRVKIKKEIDNYDSQLSDDEFMIQADIPDYDFETGAVLRHDETTGWIVLDRVGVDGVDINISEIIPMEYEFKGITVERSATPDDIEGRCNDKNTVHLNPDDGDVVIIVHNSFSHKPFFHGFSKIMNLFGSNSAGNND